MSATTTERWLREHGLVETPLLAARLRARERSRLATFAVVWAAVAGALIVGRLWLPGLVVTPGSPTATMARDAVADVLATASIWWVLGGPRRAERRLRAALPTRVARAVPLRVLGLWDRVAAAFVYAAAFACGLLAVPKAGGAAFVFLIALVACGGIAFAALRTVARRPVLAEDAVSLAADDLLRAEDARRGVAPYPLILVVPLATALPADRQWWVLGGFAVAIGAVQWQARRAQGQAARAQNQTGRPG